MVKCRTYINALFIVKTIVLPRIWYFSLLKPLWTIWKCVHIHICDLGCHFCFFLVSFWCGLRLNAKTAHTPIIHSPHQLEYAILYWKIGERFEFQIIYDYRHWRFCSTIHLCLFISIRNIQFRIEFYRTKGEKTKKVYFGSV